MKYKIKSFTLSVKEAGHASRAPLHHAYAKVRVSTGKGNVRMKKRNEQNSVGVSAGDDVYELRLRKDRDGFDLISDDFLRGPIWYAGADAVRHAVGFARYRSRTRTHYATVRVLDATGAVIQTYKASDDF